ncbi:hypothetical protein [Streptomyces griseus]|uniref:hypothetical protein n=1 Tax=Streptomyces griseus TaxID=1911 RepID=UPI0018FED0BB|nr:hypothetical protein [Streptomyces griseus]
MSADRETDNHMTHHDIALLLADAADEVEIGIAPTQAVLRGGRRRRARRWAVAAATAVVVAGSTGALALSGLPNGQERAVTPAAPQPSSTGTPNLYEPQTTMLATGTDGSTPWSVSIDVWTAPRDQLEAQAELDAMVQYDDMPGDVREAADLVGKGAYFVHRAVGEDSGRVLTTEGVVTKDSAMSGRDIQAGTSPLGPGHDGLERLVIGSVARTAQQVTCEWKDGTKSVVRRAAEENVINSDEFTIRRVEGLPFDWFVCLAPAGTEYKDVKVTG